MTTENNSTYKVRPYSKSELIEAYSAGIMSERAGERWFRKELELYPGLMDTLRTLGYQPRQRIFTRAQVQAIFDAIGAPG